MTAKHLLTLALAASACLALPTAASAEGKTDRARKAIAAAQAKIDAANIVGAAGDAPRLHAEAVATLHRAQDELDHHAKDDAIRDATRASEIADQALAASRRDRTNEQRGAVNAAQSQAAEANARAAAAQASAAAAQADAAAARAAPPVVIASRSQLRRPRRLSRPPLPTRVQRPRRSAIASFARRQSATTIPPRRASSARRPPSPPTDGHPGGPQKNSRAGSPARLCSLWSCQFRSVEAGRLPTSTARSSARPRR